MKYISTISFEITRRCNLKCKWCSKGEAQNIDISKDIIDKTLDEIQDYYINNISITGGEPFLKPDLVAYLIDKIIEKNIVVKMLHITSNATIKSEIIRDSFIRFIEYGKTIQKERKLLKRIFNNDLKPICERAQNRDIMVALFLSTWEHDNTKTINDIHRFYECINSKYLFVVDQYEQFNNKKGTVIIEGRAERTFKSFPKEELKVIRIIHNKFCIIDDSDKQAPCINKTLSVGANGKIYVGRVLSYEHIEKDYLFNILDCNGDFWNKVDSWCWKNPIYVNVNSFIEVYKSLMWQKNNGYEDLLSKDEKKLLKSMEKIKKDFDIYERLLIKFHEEVPYLGHCELNLLVVSYICTKACNDGCENIEELHPFIEYTTGLPEDTIKNTTKEDIQNVCNNLIKTNNERAIKKIKNPLIKGICRVLYV